ncbi:SusC/RagA family TonB-linked outer membrane protein [Fibrivirga algicola]|uniref:TonB-dependent receptor n=1 Tax=Fibrivirga algicola TaxID=2950420 RepID=A0ABX0QL71_9BACT|nr:TonB-dependent receptor [Fibrivirga algicola]ARK10497.1 SusC/RagA family TonB-linked outer membrane protein [Fibrella sp. ES10-3-2-2]NID12006.1 TonB-dependent receptor [Fibrivirga algicola]
MMDNSYSVGYATVTRRMQSVRSSLQLGLLSVLMLFLMLSSQLTFAQDNSVTGKVSDNSGRGLPGVSVSVKGTTRGTNSDADGNFRIGVPANAVLVFSFVGFESQDVTVGAKSVINVTLLEDNKTLNEVVVIGYGTAKKKDLTGAVNTIGTKDFNKGIITSPEQLLQGRVPGVAITQNSGEPGGGINIRIRGTSSVRSNNNPLFVVDGVPLSGGETSAGGDNSGIGSTAAKNPLNFLNPEDIASVDILKDASATAIYGSRGANGVVLITTKKGKTGKGSLEYSPSVGFSTITKRYDLLSADEYAKLQPTQDLGARVDWQDALFRTGVTNQQNLAYGGSDGVGGNYRLSLGYLDQQGIMQTSAMNRVSGTFNANKKFINNKLNVGVQLTLSETKDKNIPVTDNAGYQGDLLGGILKSNPTRAIYKADGSFNQSTNIAEPNPLALIGLSKDNTKTLRTLGNINAEYEIISGLKFKAVYGFDKSMSSRKAAFSRDLLYQDIQNVGRLILSDIEIDNTLLDGYFTYDKEFGKVSVNALLGYEYQSFDNYYKRTTATNFRTSNLDLMLNNAASADNSKGFGSLLANSASSRDELQSYFGRVNVGFGKLLATATLRADGSTRFGPGKQTGYFPSAAIAYKLSDEAFVPKNIFSDLKVRVGYGITGNQEIPHNLYQQRQRYSDWGGNADATNISGGGLNDVAFPNPNLKWEQTAQTNIGIDFGIAGGRVTGNLEYYSKNTTDLLIQVTSAQPALSPFVWKNLDANVINKGVELGLNVAAIDKPQFGWDVQFNMAYNKNEVQNFAGLINTGAISGQGLTGAFAQRIAEGQPLFAFFLRDFGGYDENGNTIYPSGDVQRFLGKSPLPTFTGGLTNNFRYKNLSLSLFFNGVFGNYIYNNTANAYFTKGSYNNGRNVTRDVPTLAEGPFNAPDVSTRFLESGSFVRLQNASLSYRFNTGKSQLSNLRLFVAAQNLFLITNYKGQDPEVNTNKSINGVPSLGIDYTAYPRARTVTVGANIAF